MNCAGRLHDVHINPVPVYLLLVFISAQDSATHRENGLAQLQLNVRLFLLWDN